MNEKFIDQLCEIIARISGSQLAEQARSVLQKISFSASEASFAKGISYLEETAASAEKYGMSLPVTAYSADFFSAAEGFITQAGNQLGFMTITESGKIYPMTGIYWMTANGSDTFYVVKIEEHDSLKSLFADIADAIRSVSGGTDPIVADRFPDAIRKLGSGQ